MKNNSNYLKISLEDSTSDLHFILLFCLHYPGQLKAKTVGSPVDSEDNLNFRISCSSDRGLKQVPWQGSSLSSLPHCLCQLLPRFLSHPLQLRSILTT